MTKHVVTFDPQRILKQNQINCSNRARIELKGESEVFARFSAAFLRRARRYVGEAEGHTLGEKIELGSEEKNVEEL
jgi:hypothetical protein